MLCLRCDRHCFVVWLGHALLTIDLTVGGQNGIFFVEWWKPMCLKKEPKSLVARECWTRQWTPEVTHPQRINITIVLYLHRMPSHKGKGPSKMHLIPEALVILHLLIWVQQEHFP